MSNPPTTHHPPPTAAAAAIRHAFLVEIDGAGFAGTQAQRAGLRTVQGELAAAFSDLAGHPVVPRLASRLDSGVSARLLPGTADLCLKRPLSPATLVMALDARLADDLALRALAVVPDDFHPIRAAVAKTYSYRVWCRGTPPAFDRRVWWVRRIDHPERLPELAASLVGTRDLRAFACLRHDDTDNQDGTRTISAAHWECTSDGAGGLQLTFTVTGSGFLYHQVRGFVGAMIAIAQGLRSREEFFALVAGDPGIVRIGNLAPPEGLVLERVAYDPEPPWVFV
jgi:tRNA pseudouridine38-40 synthase